MSDALFDIGNQVILVAGGARGLGCALAHGLAERGAVILLADRLVEEGEEVAANLPGKGHSFVPLDITDEADVQRTLDAVAMRYGKLDVVVNSVGIAPFAEALDLDLGDFEATLAVNVTGAFLLARNAVAKLLRDTGGSVISIASVSSRVANPLYSAYATSKAALSQLTRILALEWARYGVTVNAIGPAMTPTPLTEQQLLADEQRRSQALSQIPMGRFGAPEDLLGMVVLLSSKAGRFITGQTIYIDGGRTLI